MDTSELVASYLLGFVAVHFVFRGLLTAVLDLLGEHRWERADDGRVGGVS